MTPAEPTQPAEPRDRLTRWRLVLGGPEADGIGAVTLDPDDLRRDEALRHLKHYQPEHRTVIPERLVGHARRAQRVERHIILCIDQSGSMAESVVYSSVFGAVLASVRSLATRLVVFDTEVVDVTEELDDPVDVLFGVQLGGGTDINQALSYCETVISQPADTILVLISDLYEGGVAEEMLRRAAAALAAIGVPAFACTPDLFPELVATAIERRDISAWAAANDIVTTHEDED
ncbi:VWA domain-containing protein [Intrasporangium calvum]|uniref:VWA containing CoxE family protein n=1 Tax=Intrasporangium calvum (strain ATCC 23552 / DSM 43043 / JCM 3097 / NBRC 12989 / NCIMB 10167 / NRRL B-3866 / 7 KIP) TaxID=710696 RepID=E6S6M7_INTC7|nr:VWA domain-containing protein [Intrasporangium calvum]ADU50044.1 VWA containing CoxE family protein [Intrasporangium calvum DSM 43043]